MPGKPRLSAARLRGLETIHKALLSDMYRALGYNEDNLDLSEDEFEEFCDAVVAVAWIGDLVACFKKRRLRKGGAW